MGCSRATQPSLGEAAPHFKHLFDETLDACRRVVIDIVQQFDVQPFDVQKFEEGTMSAIVVEFPVRRRIQPPEAALRLTRRGRAVLVALALVIVLGAGVFGSGATADGPVPAQEVQRHAVAPGETLWQLASQVAGPGEDVRDVVLEIERLNEMASSALVAGEELLLPLPR